MRAKGTIILFSVLAVCCSKQPLPPNNIASAQSQQNSVDSAPSPSPIQPKLIDFNVRDVRLGDTESVVIEKLGKPRRREASTVDICGVTKLLTLQYEGIDVQLDSNEAEKTWSVLEIWITSPKISIEPGIRIGENIDEIERKLGPAYVEHRLREPAELYYVTSNNDNANLTFKRNELAKVRLYINPC